MLKDALLVAHVLALPNFDLAFVIEIDACDIDIAAILLSAKPWVPRIEHCQRMKRVFSYCFGHFSMEILLTSIVICYQDRTKKFS